MRAAAFKQQNQMAIIEVPEPHAGPGEVVLKVHNCGICGSDLHACQYGLGLPPDTVMGHEFCGEIFELGTGVKGFKVGERVTALPFICCGECDACRRDALPAQKAPRHQRIIERRRKRMLRRQAIADGERARSCAAPGLYTERRARQEGGWITSNGK